VADGVGHQVAQHQLHAIGIGDHRAIDRGRAQLQLDAGLARALAVLVEGLGDQAGRRDVAPVQLDLPRLDARQVEQIVDDRLQPVAVVARREQEIGLLGRERTHDPVEAQVDGHAQRRQRRAKLVRHRRHHVGLELVETAQPGHVL